MPERPRTCANEPSSQVRDNYALLVRYPSPTAIRSLGRARLATRLRRRAPRKGDRLADEIFAALAEQTVVVTGTDATAKVLPRLAEQLLMLRRQRDEIAAQVEELVDAPDPKYPSLWRARGIYPRPIGIHLR